MQTEFSKEQQLFREVVARALRDKSPTDAVRELMASERGYDPAVWQELCGEVGLSGIHIPEAYGGAGYGQIELGIVAEEMGRTLYCGPFFASAVMAASALLEAATDVQRQTLLPGIASGETIATLVVDDLNDLTRVGSSILDKDGGLSGVAPIVLDAHVATILIVVAGSDDGGALYSLGPQDGGVSVEPLEELDPTRKLCRVTLDKASGTKLGEVSDAALNRIWDHVSSALAHEMIGGAQRLLESTVEYTLVRYQFGRPIGSFQALKHRCADLLMEIEIARALVHHAARCLDAVEGEPYAASMAKAAAADAYMSAARAAIQLRGGIGFTWENDTHLWFKRAKGSEVLCGTPTIHRERMMSLLEAAS
ncbi:MAG: acyl-CoA dehydrogenase family protein [Acidobacteriota bacterium]|nr:acyl-CoA dehydrogenase family protein [Acidobacteriota bacterium]